MISQHSVLLHTDISVVPLDWVIDAGRIFAVSLFALRQMLHVNSAERHVVHTLYTRVRTLTAYEYPELKSKSISYFYIYSVLSLLQVYYSNIGNWLTVKEIFIIHFVFFASRCCFVPLFGGIYHYQSLRHV